MPVLLPIFLWDHIRAYLPTNAVEKLINTNPIFNTAFPDLFYKAKFMSQCNQSCIVVYESDIDPIAPLSPSLLKKHFWMHALENKINCKNKVSDIMNRISYHNELRTNSAHTYYKVFYMTMISYDANENYDFHHKKCSVEINGINNNNVIKYYCPKQYYEYKIAFSGIKSLVLNNVSYCNITTVISNVKSLHINNCIFGNCMLNIELTQNIVVADCKFINRNSSVVINSNKSTNCISSGCLDTINIVKNQFCGIRREHIDISVRHSSETPKINISENKFAKRQKLYQGIPNCELSVVNNNVLIDIIDENRRTNRLCVQNE